jgi:type VI secretion system protein ImpA
MHVSGKRWLDLYRYVWQASDAIGAASLQAAVLMQARALLQEEPSIAGAVFDDDTPVANGDTQRWLESEVNVGLEPEPTIEKPVLLQPPEPVAIVADGNNVFEKAQQVALEGDVAQAARVLMEDASARSGRDNFMRRLTVCRFYMQGGYAVTAANMLRRLLAEIDDRRLEQWEDREMVGEVLSMLMQTLGTEGGEEERRAIYARLCHVHPVMALDMQNLV